MVDLTRRAAFPWFAPLLLTLTLGGCQAPGLPAPLKSPIDDRSYRHVVLPNNLRALLIHAPGSDRAAAAASVARGSDQDPDAHPGLAHFVEHMLFIATEKYPRVDGFTDFVLKHGGSYRAYTANDRTTYHFHLRPDRLPEALDRFAQFFIAPRFDPAHVEREKESIQSEYQLQTRQDAWRAFGVGKQLFNPAHPASRFNIGSRETLRHAGVPEVRSFFEANYSADTITVAVLGPQSLDALQALVAERFGAVVNRGLGPPPPNPPLYRAGALPGSYAWRSARETRTLGFTFPIPPLRPNYRTKPARHLANLIGHEGTGSLRDVLSRRGWIEGLTAGAVTLDEWNATFHVQMSLTDAGEPYVAEIVDLTYAWIALIRDAGISSWRYREHARGVDLGFRFRETPTPTATVIRAAEALPHYPPEDVLRHRHLMEAFDEPLIRRFLAHLTPENALVSISGPDVDGNRVEPVFGTAWRKGPAMLPRETDAPLALPGPNPYLPEDVDLAVDPGPPTTPVLLSTGTEVETWHAPDTEFRTPTARVDLQLRVAAPRSPDDIVLASLHAELVDDAMNPHTYPARLAGLTYAVRASWTGFGIYVGGFDDNVPVLLEDVLDAFAEPHVDPGQFAAAHAALAKGYANQKVRRPHEQVTETIYHLLYPGVWPADDLLDALRRATPETLAAWRRTRLTEMRATLLVHGNLLESDARSLAMLVQRRLDIVELPHKLPSARRLEGSRRYEHAVDHDDAAYALYLQGASDDVDERARIGLIGRMLGGRYFTALRTERQLGYIVQAYVLPIAQHAGIVCVVQASTAGAQEIETLTRTFLEEQRSWFAGMSAAEFEQYKTGYVATLLGTDRNNHDRVSRLMGNLAARVLTFDERERLADAVSRLTYPEVAAGYATLIDPARGNRLTVYSPGVANTAPRDGSPVSSLEAFRGGGEGSE
ncbi:MAG: hypothetical protein F4X99_19285 [Gammaproteobacteria bacterium]|nr:hypothetical protein [Gammaproteobacteria bacterium]